MKQVKCVLLFLISVVLFSACLNPPEFDNSPTIEYNGVYFEKASNSLVISISFKDGDGDLGLSQSINYEPPFHEINFFGSDDGRLQPLSSFLVPSFVGYKYKKTKKTPTESSYYIETPSGNVGELITLRSRSEGFPRLPPFVSPYDCAANLESYLNDRQNPDTVFIFRDAGQLIKDQSTIVDTLVSEADPEVYYLAVVDYFYININPYHHNFKVQFFFQDNNGSFAEYDFRKEFCETFDGRFPPLLGKERATEGIINYSIVSPGILETFSTKTLKLVITIYDRALNTSNTLETPEFRLDEI